MRRAAIQALRTARRAPIRRILNPRPFSKNSSHDTVGIRFASSEARNHGLSHVLSSSMYSKGFSFAAIVAFASGVWLYAAPPGSEQGALVNSTTTGSGAARPSLSQPSGSFIPADARSLSPPTDPMSTSEEPAPQSQRKALVVEDDQFYTHDISDDAPLSKETGTQGQQQLEMLTPEQATEKLRKSEESYLVGRGKGVVRYDVVQIPSNNPIEDDHAEKIVEVPQSVTPSENGLASSDWMFWGVFDGHRFVLSRI